jgi:hypothetical protein
MDDEYTLEAHEIRDQRQRRKAGRMQQSTLPEALQNVLGPMVPVSGIR